MFQTRETSSSEFIFGTQIKIFLMESESSQTLHKNKGPYMIKAQKGSKEIGKIIHVTSGVQKNSASSMRLTQKSVRSFCPADIL